LDDTIILKVQDLSVDFHQDGELVPELRDVTFESRRGEIMGLVGESGCGKSLTSLAIMQLLPNNARASSGEIRVGDLSVLESTDLQMRGIRGNLVSMIFQEPMVALNPLMTVGGQIEESLQLHRRLGFHERRNVVLNLLSAVGIPEPEVRIKQYPFELSGGMRQRVMIAMALACEPALVIADEPTTALDVTIQAQILDLFRDIRKERNTSILFITHDMGVIADIADRVSVMYAGKIVETARVDDLFDNPSHPYTRGLLMSIPSITGSRVGELSSIPGSVPDLRGLTVGCPFQSRCDRVSDICRSQDPPLSRVEEGHFTACWNYDSAREVM